MISDRPSDTAQEMAVHRAAHQLFDNPRLFDDPYAISIIGAAAEAQLRSGAVDAWHAEGVQRGLRAHLVARSRFGEDVLTGAVARGVRQYVVLGAGLDTSAFRAAQKYPQLTIYEVDHPASQAWKRERLEEAGVSQASIRFAPIDFETTALADGLARVGFDPSQPTYFTWLGVVPYLTGEAIAATLGFIAGLPAGTEVVFNFTEARTEESQREALAKLLSNLAAQGEPIHSLHQPDALKKEVAAMGFSDCETFPMVALNDRYFGGGMADFMRPIRGHMMRARV
jgi:methyltransferase (TIGR00027 family)